MFHNLYDPINWPIYDYWRLLNVLRFHNCLLLQFEFQFLDLIILLFQFFVYSFTLILNILSKLDRTLLIIWVRIPYPYWPSIDWSHFYARKYESSSAVPHSHDVCLTREISFVPFPSASPYTYPRIMHIVILNVDFILPIKFFHAKIWHSTPPLSVSMWYTKRNILIHNLIWIDNKFPFQWDFFHFLPEQNLILPLIV